MRNWTLWIIGSLLVTGLYAAAPQTSGGNKDEQEIRALEERFAAAFRAKDVPAIMKGTRRVVSCLFSTWHLRASTLVSKPTKRIGRTFSQLFQAPSISLKFKTSVS